MLLADVCAGNFMNELNNLTIAVIEKSDKVVKKQHCSHDYSLLISTIFALLSI